MDLCWIFSWTVSPKAAQERCPVEVPEGRSPALLTLEQDLRLRQTYRPMLGWDGKTPHLMQKATA